MTFAEMCGDALFKDGDWIESKDQDPNGDVRIIQLADIGVGKFLDKSSRYMTLEKTKELNCTYLKGGDILIARMPDPIGRACILPAMNQVCVTAVDVCIVRLDSEEIDSRWLMHKINSNGFNHQILQFVTGTTRKRISRGNLSKLMIDIPPIDEQKRIADILDKAEEIKRSSVKTKELKKMMIDCIFREMFGEYFTDHKHAMEIENVANFIDYRGKTPPRVQAGIPLINAKCVRPGYFLKEKIDFIEKDIYSKIMTRGYPVIGDVLFTTEGATMGYTCRIPEGFDEFSVGQRLITLQTKENYNSIVLEYMLNSVEVQGKINQSATGSAAKGIRSARFAKIRIPCPPIDLQNKFASIVRKTERSNLGNISDYSTNLANSLTQEILT